MTDVRIGTSVFTAEGWAGEFYPAGMQPRDFPSYCFPATAVDALFSRKLPMAAACVS
jgi:uncharacterized protein YecE (DUF72 family)